MDKVQAVLNGYFYSKGFLRGMMNIDFVLYGGGILFLTVGTAFNFVGNVIFATIGLFAFLAGNCCGACQKGYMGLNYCIRFICDFAYGPVCSIFCQRFYIQRRIFDRCFLRTYFCWLWCAFYDFIHPYAAVLPGLQAATDCRPGCRSTGCRCPQAAAAAAYAAAHPQPVYAAAQPNPYAQPRTGSVCFSCGFPLAHDASFCPKCGSKQEKPAVSQVKRCANCGMELASDAVFCVKCGTKA